MEEECGIFFSFHFITVISFKTDFLRNSLVVFCKCDEMNTLFVCLLNYRFFEQYSAFHVLRIQQSLPYHIRMSPWFVGFVCVFPFIFFFHFECHIRDDVARDGWPFKRILFSGKTAIYSQWLVVINYEPLGKITIYDTKNGTLNALECLHESAIAPQSKQ